MSCAMLQRRGKVCANAREDESLEENLGVLQRLRGGMNWKTIARSEYAHLAGSQGVKSFSKSDVGHDIRRHIRPPLQDIRHTSVPGRHLAHTRDGHLCLFPSTLLPIPGSRPWRMAGEKSWRRVACVLKSRREKRPALGGSLPEMRGSHWGYRRSLSRFCGSL